LSSPERSPGLARNADFGALGEIAVSEIRPLEPDEGQPDARLGQQGSPGIQPDQQPRPHLPAPGEAGHWANM